MRDLTWTAGLNVFVSTFRPKVFLHFVHSGMARKTILIPTAIALILLIGLLFMDAVYLKRMTWLEYGTRTEIATQPKPSPTLKLSSTEYMLSRLRTKPSDNQTFIYAITQQTGRKNAMCISGTRMYRLTDEAVHQAMVEHVFAHSDPDIFIYGFHRPENRTNFRALFQLYGDRLIAFEIGDMPSPNATELEEMYYFPRANLQVNQHICHDNLLRPYVRQYRDRDYDVIMKTRPDMLYESPVNMSLFATDPFLPEKVFFVPPPHNVGKGRVLALDPPEGASFWKNGGFGINDQCVLASPYMMDILMHTLYGFLEHVNQTNFRIFREIRLYHYLVEYLQIRAIRADFNYSLSRGAGDKGRG